MTRSIYPLNDIEIKIKAGILEDVDRLNKIEKTCFPRELRYGPSVLATLLSMTPIYTVLTAFTTKNPEIIAFAIGEQDDNDKLLGRIITIQVHPSFWQRGVGRRLLLTLEATLHKKHGIKSFQLQVHHKNEGAIRFYQNSGYKITRFLKNYYDRKEHAFLMEKHTTTNFNE